MEQLRVGFEHIYGGSKRLNSFSNIFCHFFRGKFSKFWDSELKFESPIPSHKAGLSGRRRGASQCAEPRPGRRPGGSEPEPESRCQSVAGPGLRHESRTVRVSPW